MPSEHPATIERLRQGDRAAFDQLYERHAPRIHGFLLRLVRDPAVADDLAQDTWLAFARATPSLKDGSDLAALLFTIARNEARSYRRWSLLDLLRLAAPERDDIGDGAPTPDRWLDASRTSERLEQALGNLSPVYREPLLLVHAEGFEQGQAAQILGVSPAALRKRLSRARALLLEALAREDSVQVAARRAR
ncbi:MAG: RNA polymerase sigma factor [Polyangiaceae bacterium]|jgi:RNA polymerase sigma-70 factor (ECF subfamily)|nr:RNA polymerase sigma factor [Polyangiaceae bacterium]